MSWFSVSSSFFWSFFFPFDMFFWFLFDAFSLFFISSSSILPFSIPPSSSSFCFPSFRPPFLPLVLSLWSLPPMWTRLSAACREQVQVSLLLRITSAHAVMLFFAITTHDITSSCLAAWRSVLGVYPHLCEKSFSEALSSHLMPNLGVIRRNIRLLFFSNVCSSLLYIFPSTRLSVLYVQLAAVGRSSWPRSLSRKTAFKMARRPLWLFPLVHWGVTQWIHPSLPDRPLCFKHSIQPSGRARG